jgi:hypothetical protein
MPLLTPSIIRLQVPSKAAAEFIPDTGESNGQLTLSDHSRSPLSLSYEIIENSQRMADGSLRKYIISKKRTFSCSWDLLPTVSTLVVDNNASAYSMKRFFEINNFSPMFMTLYYKRNSSADLSYVESIQVFWNNISVDVVKRYQDFDYWNITADFVEI